MAEASGVGVGGEATRGGELPVSGGAELLVSGEGKAAGGEITRADCERGWDRERERERERGERRVERKVRHMDERERKKKEIKWQRGKRKSLKN